MGSCLGLLSERQGCMRCAFPGTAQAGLEVLAGLRLSDEVH